MAKKKCPICGKNYRNYLDHIWGAHKRKTIAYLQKKRKAAAKKPKKSRARRRTSEISNISEAITLLKEALKEMR